MHQLPSVCSICRKWTSEEGCPIETTPEECQKKLDENPIFLLSMLDDEFFKEGLADYMNGYCLEECPYSEGTDGEFGWKNGRKVANKVWGD